MKQRLFTLLVLTLLLLIGGGKNVVHAATETPGNTGTSNTAVIGTSYTLAGIYVAGSGGVKQGTMETKGIKLRTNQEGNVIVISVNSGYEINSASMYFATNGSSTLDLTGVYVDGVDQKKSATIPAKNGSTSADIVLSNLHATDNITLYFPSGSNTQIVGDFHFTYTQKAVVVQEISSVTLNGSALSAENLATLKSTKAVTIDGSSLNGCGALGVTLSSGSTTVTRSISGSTATYTFTINTSDNYTVTVNNIPKNYSKIGNVVAYSGDEVTGQNESTITMNDISFLMVNTSKTFQYGSGSVSLGGTTYVPLKLSTGSAVNVTFPTGYVATKVRVYGWSVSGNGKLASFSETNENGAKSVDVSSDIYYATNESTSNIPSFYEYTLDDWTSAYFNPGGSPSQPFVVMDFLLQSTKSVSDLTITTPADNAWTVDLDDTSADKTLQIVPSSSSNGAYTYTSSNPTVATVSETGLITAKSNGTATITVSQAATDAYQAGEATINVTVTGGVTILGTDEVSLVYTTSGYDSNTKTWTNGTYTLVSSNSISGNDGQCFKLQNYTYTLKVPSNIRVDKIEYIGYDYNKSVTEGETSTATVTVDGTTTLTGWNAYYANYASAENTTVAQEISHSAGEDITLAVTGAGQIIGTLKLYVSEIQPTAAPTLVSQSNTTKRNGSVVLTFSQPMAGATATIDGQSVTAEGGTSTLAFYYWGLDYGKQVTFTLPANAIKDAYDNNYEGEDITVNFTIDAKQALTKKKFDVIVGTPGNEDLQTVLNNYSNYSGSERKYIFIPDGSYKLTGNTSFTTDKAQTGYTYDENTGYLSDGTSYPVGTYSDNAITQLRSSNLSIIGQSKDKTILYNIPYIPGISYTSTLEFRSGSDNYLQDLTLKNMYAGGANDKGVAVAFYDRGTRTIAKNISCWSNQDTYVSNGARDYYETSTFAGTVDFICGNGDVWFQQCDLIINNRSGNVITAPRTAATEKWGYVFYENTISRAEGATLVTDKSWNLGRPWNDSPAATFLYTTMNTLPKDAGWTNMSNGKVLRFHEYGSKNASGSTLNLSSRSISACNGDASSDNPVLTAEQAAKYTIHNVLGGTDGWDPTEYTAQVSVTGLALNGNTLTWDDNEDALCWMVFKDGVYYDNVITNSVTADGAGEYTVRAANARGGLGEAVSVTVSTEAITTNSHGNASHVASKALDFSGVEGVKAYIATAADAQGITLAEVTEVPAGTAFVVQATEKAENTYYVPTTTEEVTLSSQNVFEGNATQATATEAGYTYYALSKSKGMFAKVGSSVQSIPAGKAYVKIAANAGNAKETLAFIINGETTGIAEAEAAEAQQGGVRKQLINGRLVIIKGDKRYNAAGAEF